MAVNEKTDKKEGKICSVRLTAEQRERYERFAEDEGQPLSQLFRRSLEAAIQNPDILGPDEIRSPDQITGSLEKMEARLDGLTETFQATDRDMRIIKKFLTFLIEKSNPTVSEMKDLHLFYDFSEEVIFND